MKLAPILTIALSVIPVVVIPRQAAAQDASNVKTESPFACNRLALTPEERKRHFDELSPALRSMKTATRELPDGYEFQFPAGKKPYQMLAEWVAGERVCCPFFDIELRSEREDGPLWLRLTGREGTKQFIQADFAKWFQP
jgi:hypothetical protein